MANTINPLNEFEPEVWEQSSIHVIVARVMARPDGKTFKFDAEMVGKSQLLIDWARYLVDHYVGTFELMVDLRTKQRTGRVLSEGQLKVALNTLLNVWRQSLRQAQVRTAAADPAFDAPVDFAHIKNFSNEVVPDPEGGRPSIEPQDTIDGIRATNPYVAPKEVSAGKVQRPHDGTYTYVTGAGDYRVIRFETPKESKTGATFVSYQYGPDNTGDFAKCGRIDKDGMLVIWQKGYLKGDRKVALDGTQRADLVEAIVFICSLDKDGQLKSGEAYALMSGQCFICGRPLTVPSSISAGIGPVCSKRWK